MLMIEAPMTQVSPQIDYPTHHDELNRLLSAAVVSKSFRNLLLADPSIAVASGYQGEKFNLSTEDQNWLFSIHPTNLVDLAASMVNYQQNTRQESRVKLSVEPVPHYVRVN
jgi:hypothetical protein